MGGVFETHLIERKNHLCLSHFHWFPIPSYFLVCSFLVLKLLFSSYED